ncbi:RHS repeat-associated core domain-containing protein [Brevibacillus ruminantium]|uniref:RHS repeat-associated core domain-containing protein n=1 Tax=Brevibacillus ruminantium TaxID=2950604 RepID=UPI00389916B4
MECRYRNALKYTPRSASNETTGATASYTYHPDGLRATRTAGGKETRYVYLNGKVIEELDKNNQLQARNIWGNELLFRKDSAANKQGYYLYNGHGDVVKIVGEQGEELNRYEYDTWGNIVSKTEGMSNPFAYSGEMFDSETGFYYLRARYYDPTVGRFISEDTYKGQVDNPLSLNRYAYVHNNPIRYFDPTGNKAVEYASVGGGGGGVVLPINTKEAFNIITFGILMGATAPKEVPQVTHSKPNLTVIEGGKNSNKNKPAPFPIPNLKERPKGKNIVYRALNGMDVENLANGMGIIAKNPKGDWTLEQHIIGGDASWKNDPWIATTEDYIIAKTRFNSGQGIVAIDLSKVGTPHLRAWEALPYDPTDDISAYEIALYDREVSVKYFIPRESIVGFVP